GVAGRDSRPHPDAPRPGVVNQPIPELRQVGRGAARGTRALKFNPVGAGMRDSVALEYNSVGVGQANRGRSGGISLAAQISFWWYLPVAVSESESLKGDIAQVACRKYLLQSRTNDRGAAQHLAGLGDIGQHPGWAIQIKLAGLFECLLYVGKQEVVPRNKPGINSILVQGLRR